MSFSLGKTRLRMHPLLPLLWGLSLISGNGPGLLAAFLALLIHESGHFAAARMMGIPINALEITPFGGVMHPESYESAAPAARFFFAAAGPLMSLIGCFSAVLLFRWSVPFPFVQRFARANLLLLAVNLLPALPLDGGEMLCSILSARFPPAAVTKALAAIGCAAGALLGAFSLMTAFRGELLLSPLFAGLYLIYAGSAARRESAARYVTALIARRQQLEKYGILPVEYLALAADTPARLLLSRLSLNRYHMILVLSPDGMNCMGALDEKAFCEAVMNQPGEPIGAWLKTQGQNGPPR